MIWPSPYPQLVPPSEPAARTEQKADGESIGSAVSATSHLPRLVIWLLRLQMPPPAPS